MCICFFSPSQEFEACLGILSLRIRGTVMSLFSPFISYKIWSRKSWATTTPTTTNFHIQCSNFILYGGSDAACTFLYRSCLDSYIIPPLQSLLHFAYHFCTMTLVVFVLNLISLCYFLKFIFSNDCFPSNLRKPYSQIKLSSLVSLGFFSSLFSSQIIIIPISD